MTRKTALAALVVLASALSAAACPMKSDQAMSCAEGSTWDSVTHSCVEQTSS